MPSEQFFSYILVRTSYVVPLENYCIANVKKKRIVQGWAYGRKFVRLPTEKEDILVYYTSTCNGVDKVRKF